MEFTLKATFDAPVDKIYKAWLSSEGHSEMTGGDAEISNKLGAPFSVWDGYIEGVNLELAPFSRIVQSWRTSEFKPEDEDSKLEIIFNDLDGKTELILIHTQVPEDGHAYIKGWDEHYFQPMKDYFSNL